MRKKFIIILAVIIIGLALSGYWYYKNQVFSKSILKLEILGPESAQIGAEIEYTVKYKNNSDFTLEDAKINFEYPEFSVGEEEKNMVTKTLQDIYPGDEQTTKFKVRLFGKEDDLKVAKVYLSYSPRNLSAHYESNTTFTTKIEEVPMTLDFDLPSKLETGKEIEFSLNYFSNVDYLLSGLKLTIEYPEKFDLISSDPRNLGGSEWEIADLKKAEGGRVKITGRVTAQSGERATFKAKLGIWQNGDFILLKETTKDIDVADSMLYISQQINGSSNYIASPGERLHFEIYFKNIGNSQFENLYLINKLDGSTFDLSTIDAPLGQTRSGDNLIVWDWKQVPDLQRLDVQQEGKVEFYVNLKNEWAPGSTQSNNTVAQNTVNISDISQSFQVKVNSRLVVLPRVMYEDNGIFGNSGPYPPAANQPTTYTINWKVQNLYNNVKNIKVRATLPVGVSLTGKISPSSEGSRFSFDSVSREIVWTVGDLSAGDSNDLYFQVSLSGGGTIVNHSQITGEDQWTNINIVRDGQALDTSMVDSSVPSGGEE
ncbi:MAG: hypothetical protein WC845_03080 [Candidatus Staskawiczbacteria bacterium]|jgi:hypothetical protein